MRRRVMYSAAEAFKRGHPFIGSFNEKCLKRSAENREKFYTFKVERNGVVLAEAPTLESARATAEKFPGSTVMEPK